VSLLPGPADRWSGDVRALVRAVTLLPGPAVAGAGT
jgi:hypothetical protein